jgi:hypothetical protein
MPNVRCVVLPPIFGGKKVKGPFEKERGRERKREREREREGEGKS